MVAVLTERSFNCYLRPRCPDGRTPLTALLLPAGSDQVHCDGMSPWRQGATQSPNPLKEVPKMNQPPPRLGL